MFPTASALAGAGSASTQQTASHDAADANTGTDIAPVGAPGSAPQITAHAVAPSGGLGHGSASTAAPGTAADAPPTLGASPTKLTLPAPATLADIHSASAALADSLGKAAAAVAAPSETAPGLADTTMADVDPTEGTNAVVTSDPAGQSVTPRSKKLEVPQRPQVGGSSDIGVPVVEPAAPPSVPGQGAALPVGDASTADLRSSGAPLSDAAGFTPSKRKVRRSSRAVYNLRACKL